MNPIITEFLKFFAREIAGEVAKHIVNGNSKEDAAPQPVKDEVFQPEVTAERSEEEWRADCLGIINLLAPTHGRELRGLLAKFDGAKRLSEVKADVLPSLLAELAALKDA